MNLTDPNLLALLSAEYVLGTLTGAARRRYEREMLESQAARRSVWEWEKNFAALNATIKQKRPSPEVWLAVERQIAHPTRPASQPIWRLWSIASTVAVVILALFLAFPSLDSIPEQKLPEIALFNDADNQPLWLISADLDSGRLHARAVNAQALAIDEAYELWMLPNEGPPRSLGLLPVDHAQSERILPAGLLALLTEAKGLAISREPAGGSPNGLPTTVVYQAPLLSL